MRRTPALVAGITGLALVALLPATTAAAGPAGTPGGPGTDRPHCVITALPDDAPPTSSTAAPICFGTFSEAVYSATGGLVDLPPSATTLEQSTIDEAMANLPLTLAPRVEALVGIEFQHAGHQGWSLVINSSSSSGCSNGGSYRVSSLSRSYDDQISSARSYNGCRSRHYAGASLSGSSYLCSCTSMGSMNDRTSSIRFSRTG